MGATAKYALPWPAVAGFLKDGAGAIQALAERVEAVLLPPVLCTSGDGDLVWAGGVAEVPWDVTDNPANKRGIWTSAGAAERLVIPGDSGFFLVTTSVRFTSAADVDYVEAAITTRQMGDAIGSGTKWATHRLVQPQAGSYTTLSVASVVRVGDTDPDSGIAVRLEFNGSAFAGTGSAPGEGAAANKLRIHKLSAL